MEPQQPLTQRFQNSDCLPFLRSVPAETVPLAATDQPYNIGFDYDGEYDDKRTVEDYLHWCQEWLTEVHRVLVPHGSAWFAIGPAFVSELDVLCKRLGFHKRNHVVWHYTFGVNCTAKLTPSTTHFLYYTKHRTKFTFNAAAEKVPSARQLIYNDRRANPKGRLPDDIWFLRPQFIPGGLDENGEVWYFPRVNGTFNERIGTPNQMPEQLMGRIIRLSSNPGDTVLDPFAGSATTLVVAKKLGRGYLGCEQSTNFYKLALSRLEAAADGQPLAGRDHPELEPDKPVK